MSRGSTFDFNANVAHAAEPAHRDAAAIAPERSSSWARTAQVLALVGATLPGLRAAAQPGTQQPGDPALSANAERSQEPAHRSDPAVVVRVGDVREVVAQWTPGRNFFVDGDLGRDPIKSRLTEVQAQQVAEFLAQTKYRNWTVFITDSVGGARYTDGEGKRYQGFDAVAAELGFGIQARPGFENLKDPRTGLSNEAIIFISFDPQHRAFDVRLGDTYDRYGLGEGRFKGNLDQIALPDLRDGRTAEAIRKFVTTLDQRLTAAIEQEAQNKAAAEARDAERRALAAKEAENALTQAQTSLAVFEKRLSAFQEAYPERQGDLARPDMTEFRNTLARAETAKATGNIPELMQLSRGLETSINDHLRLIDRFPGTEGTLNAFRPRLDAVSKDEYAQRTPDALEKAKVSLDSARFAWDRADKNYLSLAEAAGRDIATLESSATAARKSAESAAAVAATLKWGSGIFLVLAGLGVGGLTLGRASRARKQAEAAIGQWEEALTAKNVELSRLDERKRKVIGDFETQVKSEGATAHAARSTIRGFGELWVMLMSAQGVLDKAKTLVASGSRFSPAKYNEARALLRDTPVSFGKDSNLEAVITGKAASERRGSQLWGDLKDYKPFSLSFENLLKRFNADAERYAGQLGTIESARANLEKVTQTIAALTEDINQHAAQAGAVGFDLRTLKPFVQAPVVDAMEEGGAKASKDPLGAAAVLMTWPGRLEAIRTFLNRLGSAGKVTGTQVANADAALREARIESSWMASEHGNINTTVNQVISELASGNTADDAIEKVFTGLQQLGERARQARSLLGEDQNMDGVRVEAGMRKGSPQRSSIAKVTESLDALQVSIIDAKRKLAERLSIPEEKLLSEADLDPGKLLSEMRAKRVHAFGFLSEGNLEQVLNTLVEIESSCAKANTLVSESLDASEKYEAERKGVLESEKSLRSSRAARVETLAHLKATYDSSVLVLGHGDSSHPRSNDLLGDNIAEVDSALEDLNTRLAEAAAAFTSGKVLEARGRLYSAKACADFAEYRYLEIDERAALVVTTEDRNRTILAETQKLLSSCADELADDRTRHATIDGILQARRDAANFVDAVRVKGGDPFDLNERLTEIQDSAQALVDGIAKDWALHEEAMRSLGQARTQLQSFGKLVEASKRDDINDSRKTKDLQAEHERLSAELSRAQKTAAVAHTDWAMVDRIADEITAKATAAQAGMKKELEAAQESLKSYGAAKEAIAQAAQWRGKHGVRMGSNFGSDLLHTAMLALQAANYAETSRLAAEAKAQAESAIREANAKVRRAQQAAEQAAAAAAAARRARESSYSSSRSSSWGGGSSFGGMSSGFSGGSSFGGMSSGFSGGGGSGF